MGLTGRACKGGAPEAWPAWRGERAQLARRTGAAADAPRPLTRRSLALILPRRLWGTTLSFNQLLQPAQALPWHAPRPARDRSHSTPLAPWGRVRPHRDMAPKAKALPVVAAAAAAPPSALACVASPAPPLEDVFVKAADGSFTRKLVFEVRGGPEPGRHVEAPAPPLASAGAPPQCDEAAGGAGTAAPLPHRALTTPSVPPCRRPGCRPTLSCCRARVPGAPRQRPSCCRSRCARQQCASRCCLAERRRLPPASACCVHRRRRRSKSSRSRSARQCQRPIHAEYMLTSPGGQPLVKTHRSTLMYLIS